MKKRILFLFVLLFFLIVLQTGAQSYVATPQPQKINNNCGGYYEFLPASYSNENNVLVKYPLIVDVTGTGGQGSGSLKDLEKVLNFDIAYFIKSNRFPDTVYSNGKPYSFVVISPQLITRGKPSDIQEILTYILSRYRIDTTRIYLTGFSNGGQPVWNYPCISDLIASKVAAMVPVAGVNTNTNHVGVNYIVRSQLPVWALHSTEDKADETQVENSINFVKAINDLKPVVPAQLTLLTGTHNETWPKVYDPAIRYTVGGKSLNIYEWMLQYNRAKPILPANIQYFQSLLSLHDVDLSWEELIDETNDFFVVNKSWDRKHFTAVATIKTKRNTAGRNVYKWTDTQAGEGMNYYSLSYTTAEGKTLYSDTISINAGSPKMDIRAFPTFIHREPVNIFLSSLNENVLISIVDANGRLVYKNRYANQTKIVIPSSSLSTGLNVIQVSTTGINKKIRVLKLN
ncbi:MAG: hypothetical protein QM802_10435 [Agriterribacter sp.]